MIYHGLNLRHYNFNCAIVAETNIFEFVSTSVIPQYHNDNLLHATNFFSKKHSPAEWNNEIYDKARHALL